MRLAPDRAMSMQQLQTTTFACVERSFGLNSQITTTAQIITTVLTTVSRTPLLASEYYAATRVDDYDAAEDGSGQSIGRKIAVYNMAQGAHRRHNCWVLLL